MRTALKRKPEITIFWTPNVIATVSRVYKDYLLIVLSIVKPMKGLRTFSEQAAQQQVGLIINN